MSRYPHPKVPAVPAFARLFVLVLTVGSTACGGCEDKPAAPAEPKAQVHRPFKTNIRPPSFRLMSAEGGLLRAPADAAPAATGDASN